jgi:hypothetical protein
MEEFPTADQCAAIADNSNIFNDVNKEINKCLDYLKYELFKVSNEGKYSIQFSKNINGKIFEGSTKFKKHFLKKISDFLIEKGFEIKRNDLYVCIMDVPPYYCCNLEWSKKV